MAGQTPVNEDAAPTWRTSAIFLAIYLATTLLTRAWFMGDTIDYVIEAQRFDRSGWEFGHLVWVPLGWLLKTVAGIEDRVGITQIFLGVNWVAGLCSVLLVRGFLGRVGVRASAANLATLTFVFSHAFLDFSQTGSSYVPGLAFLMLSFYLVVPRDPAVPCERWPVTLVAGCALAVAVCFWFPYILAAPSVVLTPVFLYGLTRRRLVLAVLFTLAFGVWFVVAYGIALHALVITDVAGFREWMTRSSHGVTTRGFTRMVFGLARSFLWMGDDGVAFKRFLLKDPFHPVTVGDLARLSLWKLLVFYFSALALGINLIGGRSRGHRTLLLALAGSFPVIVFGIFWQGGDMERYFPLYPLFFLCLGVALSPEIGWGFWRKVLAVFCLVVVGINGLALSRLEIDRYQARLTERLAGIQEQMTSGSRLFVIRDRLHLLPRDFPFDPNTRELLIVEALVPGLGTTPRWREEFASQAERAWSEGGQVWLSRRLFESRPRRDSTWVEGDDPRVKWADVPAFFGTFQTREEVGGEDGFVRLPPTPENRKQLRSLRGS